jgi:uncharacterized protein (TIGR02996 family)
MKHDGSFLEAIRARPGANAVRLVYADWLEEHGNPRARFIRLQCQAAKLVPSHPRRRALESEAHALLLRHEADWLGPLLGHVSNWEFHRGLLRSVTVEAATFLAQAETWLPRLPLLGVHLRKAKGHLVALAACPQLAHLNALYLADNHLDDDDLQALCRSPHLHRLTELYLQANHFSAAGMRALASSRHLPRLRNLNLAATLLGTAEMRALVRSRQLRRLRYLDLTMTFLEVEGLRALAASPLLGRLRTLNLSSNFLPNGCLKTLVEAPGFVSLRRLLYDRNDGTDADVVALASSPNVQNLLMLLLSSNRPLSDASLQVLAASPHLHRLRTLSFGPCQGGPQGFLALGRSQTLASLRYLHLSLVGDSLAAHAPYLLRGRLVRRLRDLSFQGRAIGAAGLETLASHPAPLRLRKLVLPLGLETAPAWEALLAKGSLSQLTDLTLIDPPSTSLRAMLPAGRLPQLDTLKLFGLPPHAAECRRFLGSPLAKQLRRLDLFSHDDEQKPELLKRLLRSAAKVQLQHLGLDWSLTPAQVQLLAGEGTWPQLTSLMIGSLRLGKAGMEALAAWPLLGQLRELVLQNSSSLDLPGLDVLAHSPHLGPLLRIDIHNGSVAPDVRKALRQRMGGRFSAWRRKYPRVLNIGSWGSLLGDDD